MPAITANSRKTFGYETLLLVDSDGADSLTYNNASNQVLQITNGTGAQANLNIIGADAPDDYKCLGTGEEMDLTAGYPVVVEIGASVKIELNSISQWLIGSVTITGGATTLVYTLTES